MAPELVVLALAGLLQMSQLALLSLAANLELDSSVTFGPRDEARLEERLSVRTGRIKRALDNHFEALTLFTIAVLVVVLGGAGSAFTAACAWLYLAARVLYVPAYVFGWVPGRSIIWAVGTAATGLMLLAGLLGGLFGGQGGA